MEQDVFCSDVFPGSIIDSALTKTSVVLDWVEPEY